MLLKRRDLGVFTETLTKQEPLLREYGIIWGCKRNIRKKRFKYITHPPDTFNSCLDPITKRLCSQELPWSPDLVQITGCVPSKKDSLTDRVPTDRPYMWYQNDRTHCGPV